MASITNESRFVRRVRSEMTSQGLSIRGLARKIDPANLDRVRRNIHRWLDEGIAPSRASRREVAHALGLAEADLADDEESDLVAALLKALDRYVDDRLARVPA